jgi:hypothetical protein
MVHAIAAQFPFTGGGTLALYHPSPVERFFPVAPGIEVSVEPGGVFMGTSDPESFVYNRRGRMISPQKGDLRRHLPVIAGGIWPADHSANPPKSLLTC